MIAFSRPLAWSVNSHNLEHSIKTSTLHRDILDETDSIVLVIAFCEPLRKRQGQARDTDAFQLVLTLLFSLIALSEPVSSRFPDR